MTQVIERPAEEHAHDSPTSPPAGSDPATGQPQVASARVDQRDRATRIADWFWARQSWAAPLAVLGCFAAFSAVFLANDPTDGRADALSGCALKLLTGFDCPGCGGTRAFWYLVHGNLPEAARYHVMAVFAAPFLVYAYLAWAANKAFGLAIPQLRLKPRWLGYFFAAWGVWAVARNLPWEPFTLWYV